MCGTADGYAMNDLNQFVKEKPDREFLESWLKWWDNRREFIFNAFMLKVGPKMNQAEVIHAGWAHQDGSNPRSNLSLLDAAHMDTRGSEGTSRGSEGTSSGAVELAHPIKSELIGVDLKRRRVVLGK